MDADLKKMKKLARTMRKEGVLVYKTPEIELSLSPSAVFKEEAEPRAQSDSPDNETDPNALSPEDILLWSAGGAIHHEEAI